MSKKESHTLLELSDELALQIIRNVGSGDSFYMKKNQTGRKEKEKSITINQNISHSSMQTAQGRLQVIQFQIQR